MIPKVMAIISIKTPGELTAKLRKAAMSKNVYQKPIYFVSNQEIKLQHRSLKKRLRREAARDLQRSKHNNKSSRLLSTLAKSLAKQSTNT